jgi:hypothetical protein
MKKHMEIPDQVKTSLKKIPTPTREKRSGEVIRFEDFMKNKFKIHQESQDGVREIWVSWRSGNLSNGPFRLCAVFVTVDEAYDYLGQRKEDT